jgi:hypothetical protein
MGNIWFGKRRKSRQIMKRTFGHLSNILFYNFSMDTFGSSFGPLDKEVRGDEGCEFGKRIH